MSKKVNTKNSKNAFEENAKKDKGGPTMDKNENKDILNQLNAEIDGEAENSGLDADIDKLINSDVNSADSDVDKIINADETETNHFDNSSDSDSKKSGNKNSRPPLDTLSQQVVGTVTSAIRAHGDNVEQNTGYIRALRAHSESARIIGYINKSDERTDFVKVKNKETGLYRINLRNSAPSPITGFMVSSPADLLQIIKQQGVNLTNEAVEELKNKPVKVKEFQIIPKVNNKFHTFLTKNCANYLIEEENLFVPYAKITRSKDSQSPKTVIYDKWDGSTDPQKYNKYIYTGGKAGIFASIKHRAARVKPDESSKAIPLKSITSKSQLEFVPVLTNSARPKLGLAPGNYISESKYQTINVKDIIINSPQDAHNYTLAYFDRYIDFNATEVQNEKSTKIQTSAIDTKDSKVKFNDEGGSIVADCFAKDTKDSFWGNVSVDHWYNVDTKNNTPVKIKGTDINLVLREASESKSKDNVTSTVYKYVKSTLGSDEYPFTIPEKILAAAKAEGVEKTLTSEGLSKIQACNNTKSTGKNAGVAKSLNKTFHLMGTSIEDIMRVVNQLG